MFKSDICFVGYTQQTYGYWAYPPAGRKKHSYSNETLQTALSDIQQGKSLNRASKEYEIPLKTLHDAMLRYGIKSKHQWRGNNC